MSRSLSQHLLIPAVVIFAGLVAANALRADVIYTNFGTDDSYSAGAGVIVTNDDMAWSSVAIAFTPVANYTLSSIGFVATGFNSDGSDSVTLAVFADNNGQPASNPLESFAVGSLGQFGNLVPVMTVNSVLQPLLLEGTQYWIGMNAPANDLIIWNQNITSAEGFSQTDGNSNWSVSNLDQGVVEVDGTLAPAGSIPLVNSALGDMSPVPEPNAWWLAAAGLCAIAARSRPFTSRS